MKNKSNTMGNASSKRSSRKCFQYCIVSTVNHSRKNNALINNASEKNRNNKSDRGKRFEEYLVEEKERKQQTIFCDCSRNPIISKPNINGCLILNL